MTAEPPLICYLDAEDLPSVWALWEAAGLPFHPSGRDSAERMGRELA